MKTEFVWKALLIFCLMTEKSLTEEYPSVLGNFIIIPSKGIPLGLNCDIEAADGQIHWMKDNVTVTDSEDIKIQNKGLTLVILNTFGVSLGTYTCKSVNSGKILATYHVISKPVVEFSSKDPPSVVKGGTLQLTCVTPKVYGPNITWIFGGKLYQRSEGRVTISTDKNTGIEGAVLVVEDLQMDEFDNITCRVQFDKIDGGFNAEITTHVRAENKLAVLWPALDICAVLILVVVVAIILYRKKRARSAVVDDSNPDQNLNLKKWNAIREPASHARSTTPFLSRGCSPHRRSQSNPV